MGKKKLKNLRSKEDKRKKQKPLASKDLNQLSMRNDVELEVNPEAKI